MKKIAVLITFASALFAQTPVDVSGYPSSISRPTEFFDYSGFNLIYACYAKPLAPNSTNPGYNFSLSVTGTTLTSIVVLTNVGTVATVSAHGLRVGNKVVVSGSTTSALNGSYVVQTVPTSTTVTITTSGVGNATYNNGALTFSGSVPLLTGAIWSIMRLNYDGSNNVINVEWANGTPGNPNQICANRASLYYQ